MKTKIINEVIRKIYSILNEERLLYFDQIFLSQKGTFQEKVSSKNL